MQMSKKKKKQLRKERQEQDGRESNEKSREVSPENMSSDEQQKEKKEQGTTTTMQMSNKKTRRERKLRQFKHEMSLIKVDQETLKRRKQQIEEQREAQRKQKQKREEWKNGKLSVEIVDQIKKRIRIIEFLDLQARHIRYESEKIKKGLLLESVPLSSSAKKEQLHKTSEEKGEYASFFYETTKEEWGGEEEQMGYCVAGKSGVRIFCLLQLLCFFISVANYCAISSITSKVSLILC